jgi:hypothetical protein
MFPESDHAPLVGAFAVPAEWVGDRNRIGV